MKKYQEDKDSRPMKLNYDSGLTLFVSIMVTCKQLKLGTRSSNSFSKMLTIYENFNECHDRFYDKN